MKVYVLRTEFCKDFDCYNDICVFNSIEKAIEKKELLEKQIRKECDYDTINKTTNYFEMYDNGYFAENHIGIYIEEKEVE